MFGDFIFNMKNLFTDKKGELEIEKGWVTSFNGNSVKWVPSPNYSQLIDLKFLVIHFTASKGSARNIADYFSKSSSKVSAHFVIDFDGTVYQCVPLDKTAWHAGKSSWLGYSSLNRYSIGIEVCNVGPLTKVAEGKYKTWWGEILQDERIFEEEHPITGEKFGWIPFNEKQVDSLIELGRLLYEHFGLRDCVGHDMISPFRKVDPGPTIDTRVYDIIIGKRHDDASFYGLHAKSRGPFLTEEGDLINDDKERKVFVIDRKGYMFYLEIEGESKRAYAKIHRVIFE